MPAALFYGKGTHAGEPLKGLSSHYMAAFLNKAMELSDEFKDTSHGEETPLPVILKTFDLKQDYSVQTSHHVAALYNVFIDRKSTRLNSSHVATSYAVFYLKKKRNKSTKNKKV